MSEALGILERPDGEREYYTMPMRYDIATDAMVPVTQEWVNFVQRQFAAFGKARQASKEFLDAWRPEFEQKPEQS